MSDPETRDEIRKIIFDGCPLRELLKKPCPYFGASESCRDCTYDWMTIADNVRKVAEKRRASYEKEREKNEQLRQALEEKEQLIAEVGVGLMLMIREARCKTEGAGSEETDVGRVESENSES